MADLPCGWCRYCERARRQWQTFVDDVDFIVPLLTRSKSHQPDKIVTMRGLPIVYSPKELSQLQRHDKQLSTTISLLVFISFVIFSIKTRTSDMCSFRMGFMTLLETFTIQK